MHSNILTRLYKEVQFQLLHDIPGRLAKSNFKLCPREALLSFGVSKYDERDTQLRKIDICFQTGTLPVGNINSDVILGMNVISKLPAVYHSQLLDVPTDVHIHCASLINLHMHSTCTSLHLPKIRYLDPVNVNENCKYLQ
jgi:hypothetical protein